MRDVRSRIQRIESHSGATEDLWFLQVGVRAGESTAEALERVCRDRGILQDQIGRAIFIGEEVGWIEEDYAGIPAERLRGHREFQQALEDALEEIARTSTIRPPSQR